MHSVPSPSNLLPGGMTVGLNRWLGVTTLPVLYKFHAG